MRPSGHLPQLPTGHCTEMSTGPLPGRACFAPRAQDLFGVGRPWRGGVVCSDPERLLHTQARSWQRPQALRGATIWGSRLQGTVSASCPKDSWSPGRRSSALHGDPRKESCFSRVTKGLSPCGDVPVFSTQDHSDSVGHSPVHAHTPSVATRCTCADRSSCPVMASDRSSSFPDAGCHRGTALLLRGVHL